MGNDDEERERRASGREPPVLLVRGWFLRLLFQLCSLPTWKRAAKRDSCLLDRSDLLLSWSLHVCGLDKLRVGHANVSVAVCTAVPAHIRKRQYSAAARGADAGEQRKGPRSAPEGAGQTGGRRQSEDPAVICASQRRV